MDEEEDEEASGLVGEDGEAAAEAVALEELALAAAEAAGDDELSWYRVL